jgi:hypothetical protein
MALRFRYDFACNYLLIGGDGPYYPLQVRSILEHGKLAFPDMPLLFWLQAFLAKIFSLFQPNSLENNILSAIKTTDILLPPLAALPLFWITTLFAKAAEKNNWRSFLLIAYAVLNLSVTFFFMNSGLQKNAVALVFIFFYLYYVIDSFQNGIQKNAIKIAIILILCALTHFGTFSLLLFFSFLLGFFYLIFEKNKLNIKIASIAILSILSSSTLLYSFDNHRFIRLFNIPLKIFEAPIYLYLAKGEIEILSPIVMFQVLAVNILAIFALIFYVLHRNNFVQWEKILSLSLLFSSFALASPLLGLEWSNRLYLMCFIPITILYFLIFAKATNRWFKLFPTLIFVGLLLLSLGLNTMSDRATAITDEAYSELLSIKNQISLPKNALIIGRQDLRLLGSWVFGNVNKANYLLKKEDFARYDGVYILLNLKGNNLSSPRFRQMTIPSDAKALHKGKCFELYQLSATSWVDGNDKPAICKGKIIHFSDNQLIIKNEATDKIQNFTLPPNTEISLSEGKNTLTEGLSIAIYGSRKAFSLSFDVEMIKEIKE